MRLSGGQRQRIGIARAMYHDPEVLILDEATSSLDNITEAMVMEAIRGLARKKTIIMIAHRLTTLVDCDVIHFLSKGQVICSGTYSYLMDNSPEFRAMAKENSITLPLGFKGSFLKKSEWTLDCQKRNSSSGKISGISNFMCSPDHWQKLQSIPFAFICQHVKLIRCFLLDLMT